MKTKLIIIAALIASCAANATNKKTININVESSTQIDFLKMSTEKIDLSDGQDAFKSDYLFYLTPVNSGYIAYCGGVNKFDQQGKLTEELKIEQGCTVTNLYTKEEYIFIEDDITKTNYIFDLNGSFVKNEAFKNDEKIRFGSSALGQTLYTKTDDYNIYHHNNSEVLKYKVDFGNYNIPIDKDGKSSNFEYWSNHKGKCVVGVDNIYEGEKYVGLNFLYKDDKRTNIAIYYKSSSKTRSFYVEDSEEVDVVGLFVREDKLLCCYIKDSVISIVEIEISEII